MKFKKIMLIIFPIIKFNYIIQKIYFRFLKIIFFFFTFNIRKNRFKIKNKK